MGPANDHAPAPAREELQGRLSEVCEVMHGLRQLDADMRRTAAEQLGKAPQEAYAALHAQASLIGELMKTLTQRRELLARELRGGVEEPNLPGFGVEP